MSNYFNKQRRRLKVLYGKGHLVFEGIYQKTHIYWNKEMICLRNITYKNSIYSDHVWIENTNIFKRLNLEPGGKVRFKAIVTPYAKKFKANPGTKFMSREMEYCLASPSNVIKVTEDKKGEINNMEKEIKYEIKKYSTNTYLIPVRFDYKNNTVWLTQEEIATICVTNIKVISRRLKEIEKREIFDLQSSKMRITKNNRKVNAYSSLFLFELKKTYKEDEITNFLDWCQINFDSKDLDDYKIVRFTQDNLELNVRFTNDYENAWLNQKEISELYGVSIPNISTHMSNIFSQGELEKVSVVKFFLNTGLDGKQYETEYYNLDMILSIGYRVNSRKGVAFRKWANSVLKDYLIKGYAINDRRLNSLGKTVEIQNRMLATTMSIDYIELSNVINEYTNALDLLDDYDHQRVQEVKGHETLYELTYEDARKVIDSMKFNNNSTLFGKEKEEGKLEGILAAVYQSVFGEDVYKSLESKAAHLLYFLVKDHPFYDGCKRIAATLFLEFLNRNNALVKNGELTLSSDALVAITLLTAESNPEEMDIIVSVITNILVQKSN